MTFPPGWPVAALALMVLALRRLSRYRRLSVLFRWLPVPLWCYLLPMTAVTFGRLPAGDPLYKTVSDGLLPVALCLLLLGVDLVSVLRTGRQALLATFCGAFAVMAGAVAGVRLFGPWLPAESWKGAGALAATWTGGTMNLLALRSMLEPPEAVFSPLILIDALVAYSWMALLVAASSHQDRVDRWLLGPKVNTDTPTQATLHGFVQEQDRPAPAGRDALAGLALSIALAAGCRALAPHLPRTAMTASALAWTVLLATTACLLLSGSTAVRRIGQSTAASGNTALCLVLSLAGAQASLSALRSAPGWLGVGATVLLLHASVLILVGRLRRIPLRILATASQANIGGFVSAPLVGALYHPTLAPVGLLLAIGCNAVGTYAGLLTAAICRAWLGV